MVHPDTVTRDIKRLIQLARIDSLSKVVVVTRKNDGKIVTRISNIDIVLAMTALHGYISQKMATAETIADSAGNKFLIITQWDR